MEMIAGWNDDYSKSALAAMVFSLFYRDCGSFWVETQPQLSSAQEKTVGPLAEGLPALSAVRHSPSKARLRLRDDDLENFLKARRGDFVKKEVHVPCFN